MIKTLIGVLYQSGSGNRDGYISSQSLDAKQPALYGVRTPNFKNQTDVGWFNSLWVNNTQLFRTSCLPQVPSHISSSVEYGSAKKIMLRQHVSFWTSASYSSGSLGDGINPGTAYNTPLFALTNPQMKQQSATTVEFIHSITPLTGFNFLTAIGTGVVSPLQTWSDFGGAFPTIFKTKGYLGAEIHNFNLLGSLAVYNQRTPSSSGGGFFSRALPIDGSTPPSTNPDPFDWLDCLNDKVIAGSRNQYGYGNTSNGGLSSYSADVSAWQVGLSSLGLATQTLPAVQNNFTDLASPTAFMTFNEPATNEALTLGNNATLPSLTTGSLNIFSNSPVFGSGASTLWQRGQIGLGAADITIIHRIESLRFMQFASQDENFDNPSEPIHI